MALTKVTTGGITDATIATADIADQAITLDKLPHGTSSNNGKFLRANNGADPSFETVTSTTINNNADNRVITGSGTANTLNAESNVHIDGSGQLGVGTSSPGQLFSLRNTSSQCQQSLTAATNGSCCIYFGDTDSVNRSTILHHNTGDYLAFGTAASERMRIDSSGNVLIRGTSLNNSSVSGQALQVNGTDRPTLILRGNASGSNTAEIQFADNSGSDSDPGTRAGLIQYVHSDNSMRLFTAETERMRITSDGKVGIDVAGHDPLTKLHVQGNSNAALLDVLTITNSPGSAGTEVGMVFECGADELARISAKHEGSDIGPLVFSTASSQTANPSEKMRLTSGGRLLVHTTTNYNGYLSSYAESGQPYPIAAIGGNTSQGLIGLYYSTSLIGSITVTGGGSSVAYNTSSDYRLKENVVDLSNGIARLKTLIPRRFNWKDDKSTTVDGFVAHEVTAVPEAVTGTKDQVVTEDNEETGDKKGDPIYQQIDQSKLVPLLTAALQEAVAKIEVLETKVAALEAA